MWSRYTKYDLRVVAHFLGVILLLTAASMLIPLVVALFNAEWNPALDFFFSSALGFAVGTALLLVKVRPGALDSRQAILLTALTWVLISLLGAVPLYLTGNFESFFDAFFDSVSGFTTTGCSLISDVDHLAYSHNIWRLITHVIGGQGIIAFALTVGVFSRSAGAGSLYKAEGKSDSILPNIVQTVRFSLWVTIVFVGIGTLLLSMVLLYEGLSLGRAVFHSFSISAAAFGTGGFAPMSNSITYYHSLVLELILMVLMCAGALNFTLYFAMWRGNIKEFLHNIEVKTLAIWGIVVTLIFSVSFAHDELLGVNVLSLIRRGIFTVVAAISNAGFTSFYTSQISLAATPAIMFSIILAMSIGGATGSTSGGIKALRIALIFKSVLADIKSALSPETARMRVKYHHMADRTLDSETASSAMTVFLLFALTYVFGTMVAVSLGYPPLAAAFESVSVTSNAGMSAGIVDAQMPSILKLCYILQMWAGRLEFLALLALGAGIFVSLKPRNLGAKSLGKER